MLTKAPSSLVTRRKEEEKRSLIMSKWNPGSRPCWSGEWSGLMSLRKYSTIIIMPWEARPGIILEEKKSLCRALIEKGQWERETEKERSEEQRRGGGAQFRQEIPAEKVGLCPNYTALCQRLYTNAHEHAYTLTNTHRHWFVLQLTLSESDWDQRVTLSSNRNALLKHTQNTLQ